MLSENRGSVNRKLKVRPPARSLPRHRPVRTIMLPRTTTPPSRISDSSGKVGRAIEQPREAWRRRPPPRVAGDLPIRRKCARATPVARADASNACSAAVGPLVAPHDVDVHIPARGMRLSKRTEYESFQRSARSCRRRSCLRSGSVNAISCRAAFSRQRAVVAQALREAEVRVEPGVVGRER